MPQTLIFQVVRFSGMSSSTSAVPSSSVVERADPEGRVGELLAHGRLTIAARRLQPRTPPPPSLRTRLAIPPAIARPSSPPPPSAAPPSAADRLARCRVRLRDAKAIAPRPRRRSALRAVISSSHAVAEHAQDRSSGLAPAVSRLPKRIARLCSSAAAGGGGATSRRTP